MNRVFTALALAAVLSAAGCSNKELQKADNLAATGDLQKAIEAYNGVIESGKDADRARISLAGVYCTQKKFEKAQTTLEALSSSAAGTDEAKALTARCGAARLLLDGIKSATVQFRQQFIKAKEVAHEEIDYDVPIFKGTAPELFEKAGVKMPAGDDLARYAVTVTQTDDPLEPTRLHIAYPDGSEQELSLNY